MVLSIWTNHQTLAHMKSSPGSRESSESRKLVIQELWIQRSQAALSSAFKGTILYYSLRATRLVKSQQSAGK